MNRERQTEKKHKRRQINKQKMKQREDTNKQDGEQQKEKKSKLTLGFKKKLIQEEGVKVPSEAFFKVHSASNKVQQHTKK